MKHLEFHYRLAYGVPAEHEWVYLVNETYIGERCIMPILEGLREVLDYPAFDRMIARQLGEEERHYHMYRGVLGQDPVAGSGYDQAFSAFVDELPNPTLKLFAIQPLLEGIALAAIRYRLDATVNHHAAEVDQQILADEERHTRYAYGFMRVLMEHDGALADSSFAETARRGNALFRRHFNGQVIARLLQESCGAAGISASDIDRSEGMRRLSRLSARTIVEQKSAFLARYRAVRGSTPSAR